MAIKISNKDDAAKNADALVSIMNYCIEQAEGLGSPVAVKLLQIAADEISKACLSPRLDNHPEAGRPSQHRLSAAVFDATA